MASTNGGDRTAATAAKQSFLPDFCHIRMVFSVVIIAELLAFMMTLSAPTTDGAWRRLSLISLFVQWVALASTATLCCLKRYLARVSDVMAVIVSYGVIMTITLLVGELAYWGGRHISYGMLGTTMTHLEFTARNLGISAVVGFLALRYFYVRHQLKLNIEAENQSRMQALQARIRPHFLFNSLNAIATLIRRAPDSAEEAVEDLADLFRTSLDTSRALVPFAEEVEIARRYLHMEQLRLGDRLRVVWQVDTIPDDAAVPALTLQPLLENAIYHGIEPLAEGGAIECRGEKIKNTIRLSVGNPVTQDSRNNPRHGLQLALDNIRQRLLAHFEDAGRIRVETPPGYYLVTLRFPYQALNRALNSHENTHR